MAETIERSMKILARDHLGDPRLGPLCLQLVLYPSPRRDVFLRAVAEKSPDRVVRGRAMLALAQYLKNKGEFVRDLKKPDIKIDQQFLRAMYSPEYLAQLRATDPDRLGREADQLLTRVARRLWRDRLHTPLRSAHARDPRRRRPSRAEAAAAGAGHRSHGAVPVDRGVVQFWRRAADRAEKEAQKKAGKTEPSEESIRAYIAAYPKWGDYGPKLWRLAQDSPRHQAAFEALIWLVGHGPSFFDARVERDALMSQVVDALIHDHLETIAGHLTDRNVAMALNMSEQIQTPYFDRLLRALFERGRDRPARGRMGLALGRYLKAEADCIARLTRPETDSRRPLDLYFLDPAFADQLRKTDRAAIEHKAEDVLKRVIDDYGDVLYFNGAVTTQETLANIAKRELAEIRSLSVGKTAPEIVGDDVQGKPMKLSEFRGKVVLLDFGSHEHCSGCVQVYPRLRSTLDRLRDRPFAILGINNHDHRNALRQAIARGEITWRCWWDGDSDKLDRPGPIATSWNVRGYPTFFLIDHRGVIRSKADLHPFDTPSFDNAIEALLKEAEAAGPRH